MLTFVIRVELSDFSSISMVFPFFVHSIRELKLFSTISVDMNMYIIEK